MAPRVSVVMPVYNGARFLAEAIESVCRSTFRDFELLVLDDLSSDNSAEIADRLAANDSRIRVLRMSERHGVSRIRNVGVKESKGEYIANLDADDVMFPNRLSLQVAYLDSHPDCVALGARALVVDADGRPQSLAVRVFTHRDIDDWHMSGLGGGLGNPMAMFRKSAVEAIGGYTVSDDTAGEDYDLWLRLAEYGQLANLSDVLICYRVHDKNLSTRASEAEYRKRVTLEVLSRAFERRGIRDRKPARVEPKPMERFEVVRDEALLLYFRGNRMGSLLRALRACVHNPSAESVTGMVKTILAGPRPHWGRPH